MSCNVIGFPKYCERMCCIPNNCDELRKVRRKGVPVLEKPTRMKK